MEDAGVMALLRTWIPVKKETNAMGWINGQMVSDALGSNSFLDTRVLAGQRIRGMGSTTS